MEEFKESVMGIVVLFIVKVIIAIAMDTYERDESIDSVEMTRMLQQLEDESNVSIMYLFEESEEN